MVRHPPRVAAEAETASDIAIADATPLDQSLSPKEDTPTSSTPPKATPVATFVEARWASPSQSMLIGKL